MKRICNMSKKEVKEKITKKDFIDKLMSMTHQEINDFIKANGKGPKPCRMCHIVTNKVSKQT